MIEKYIVGIDAGFVSTGLILLRIDDEELVYVDSHTIQTSKQDKKKNMRVADDDVLRVQHFVQEMFEFISSNKLDDFCRIYFVVELPTGGAQGARSNRAMGISTGATVAFLSSYDTRGVHIVEYITPTEVKMAMVGSRKASKDEMISEFMELMAASGMGKLPKNKLEHIADAYGAVLHAWMKSEMFKVFKNSY